MKILLLNLLIASAAVLVASCSSEEICTIDNTHQQTQIKELKMDVSIQDYDSSNTTRATKLQFIVNDSIYLIFENGEKKIMGQALYIATDSTWHVVYDGQLMPIEKGRVRGIMVRNKLSESDDSLCLSAHTAVYHDDLGEYSFDVAGVLKITLNLTPLSGRIRFEGEPNTNVTIYNLSTIKSISKETGEVTCDTNNIDCLVDTCGFTPYIYAAFADEKRELKLSANMGTFSTICSSNVFETAKSGRMTLPTVDNHNGWTLIEIIKSMEFNVNGVAFTMIPVIGGTFTMGSTSEQEIEADINEKPAHQVKLNNYYIGETEVTQALWYALMGAKPSSFYSWKSLNGLGDEYPAYYISWNECQTFIQKLNTLTGKNFRLPTEAEWEYAARGGNKSRGYKYSGSNTIDDVAWYTVNAYDMGSASPDYGTHPVATKQPNELGIYDMSGNVQEWCQDWYGDYSSNVQTNPTGPSGGSSHVSRGGSWFSDARHCRVSCRKFYSPDDHGIMFGFRLALSE